MRRILIIFLFGFVILITTSISAQEDCRTCHEDLFKGKLLHSAAESCDSCHEEVATPHPQEGKKTFKLSQQAPDLCSACHEPVGQKKTVHSPVKEGMCLDCHNPHSSDQPKLLAQPLKDLCANCHSDKTEFKNVHGPTSAGECTTCHAPHESDTPALLVKEGAALCMECHQDFADTLKKSNVHAPAQDSCTTCHNPHGSDHNKLLASEGGKLCFECHTDVSEKLQKGQNVHAAVTSEKACVSCHSPHASDHGKLLFKVNKDLCLDCHSKTITQSMRQLHAPIKEGNCTPCHDPHSSANPALLVKQFPATQYVAYSEKEYDICFSCHNRDLLAYPDTSFATNFRDGERNLHYLHVNKEKGRSCTFCHNVHGSNNQKLIADSVSFGKWDLSLKFQKTENGGSCSPGCHKLENYKR